MDIQEIINYSKNKIESDDLTKQVRQRIKETAWEKQNQREGFSETFKPLISQFEKPEDTKTKNIFTQNQEMLKNQLALTEGLRANQQAITKGFKQFERLADMRDLPQIEDFDGDNQDQSEKTPIIYNLEKNFEKDELKNLSNFGYPRPNNFIDINPKRLQEIYEEVNNDKTVTGNLIGALKRTKNKTEAEKFELSGYINQHNLLSKYKNTIKIYLNTINFRVGDGQQGRGIMSYFSPQELLKRLELLGGSLAAGNNGVLTEYIQIAHRLRDLGVVTNNQLNNLLRKYIHF